MSCSYISVQPIKKVFPCPTVGDGRAGGRVAGSGPERGPHTDGEVCPYMGWESPVPGGGCVAPFVKPAQRENLGSLEGEDRRSRFREKSISHDRKDSAGWKTSQRKKLCAFYVNFRRARVRAGDPTFLLGTPTWIPRCFLFFVLLLLSCCCYCCSSSASSCCFCCCSSASCCCLHWLLRRPRLQNPLPRS